MSSKFEVTRICECCKKKFTAHTTTTRYCSRKCNTKAYKDSVRSLRVEITNIEAKQKPNPIDQIKLKEFLSVRDVAVLLNCSIRTVYLYIDSGKIHAVKLSERITRIRRADIDELFQGSQPLSQNEVESEPEPIQYEISECYNLSEIQKKYGISDGALYDLIKRHNIPKIKKAKYTYVPKKIIDKIFNLANN